MSLIRYSNEVRTAILRRIESGEVSHAQAMREVGCSKSTLQQWLKSHRGTPSPRTPHGSSDSPVSFIPVHLSGLNPVTLEIVTPSGIQMRFTGVTSGFVMELLQALA